MEDFILDSENLSLSKSKPLSNNARPNMHDIVMLTYPFKSEAKKGCSTWKRLTKKLDQIEDPWNDFKISDYPEEKAVCHYYDPMKKIWKNSECLVKMEWPREPFASGAMRDCYRLYDLTLFIYIFLINFL